MAAGIEWLQEGFGCADGGEKDDEVAGVEGWGSGVAAAGGMVLYSVMEGVNGDDVDFHVDSCATKTCSRTHGGWLAKWLVSVRTVPWTAWYCTVLCEPYAAVPGKECLVK